MKKCFFVTPIGESDSADRLNSDKVLKNILEPVLSSDFEIIRIDKLNLPDNIDQTIINHLASSELVIIDMTNHNPNVFYEFGYRHALKLPLIPIINKNSGSIPFDVSTLRTIFYTFDVEDVNEAKERLEETITAFDFSETVKNTTKVPEKHKLETIQILNINDKLDNILNAINTRNDTEIETIASLISKYATPKKTTEETLMEQLLPMLMGNPENIDEKLNAMQKISEFGNNQQR